MACSLRLGRHDGELRPHDGVKQGRFADVGHTNDSHEARTPRGTRHGTILLQQPLLPLISRPPCHQIPLGHTTTFQPWRLSYDASSTRTLVSVAAPRPGSWSTRFPSRSESLVGSIAHRLAIRLRILQPFDSTLWIILRQQFTALL